MDKDFGLHRVWSRSGDGEEYDQAKARELREFDQIGCLVLLGPPGAGKTTELEAAFQESAAAGWPAALVRLREVTDRSAFRSLITRGLRKSGFGAEPSTLFLDGLDELPVGDATLRLDLLDALAALSDEGRSSPAGRPPRLRITCRSAQLPDDFVRGLEIAWEGDVALLRLEPLTEEDVLLAATRLSSTDARQFAYYLDKRGLKSLTSNPMTLRMLVRLFESDQEDLPEDLAQGYRATTSEMLAHVRGLTRQDDPFSLQRARRLLGRLAAVCALSGRYVLWTGMGTDPRPLDAIAAADASGGIEEVGGRPFQADEGSIRAVMRPGFFDADGPNRLAWPHRSFAEFLAADYLAETPMDRGRLIDLLTIQDAEGTRVVPELREVASWLAGMDAEIRRSLVRSEPVLLLRSDVASADDGFKAALTTELLDRLEAGGSEAFRFDPTVRPDRLLYPGLASLLKPWVRGKHFRLAARRFAVDVARHCGLADLSQNLLDVASDESEPASLRASAAAAAGELDADASELAALRNLLGSGADADPQDELRGVALRILWPRHLTSEELFEALAPPRDDTLYGWYKAFIYELEPSSFDQRALISGLRWLDRLRGTYQSIMVFRQFIPKLMRAAWAASLDEMVRAALGDVLINSASDYEHPTRLFDRAGNDPNRPRSTAAARAQMFSDLVVRAGDDGGALAKWTLYGPTPALVQEDLAWLLDQAGQLPEAGLSHLNGAERGEQSGQEGVIPTCSFELALHRAF